MTAGSRTNQTLRAGSSAGQTAVARFGRPQEAVDGDRAGDPSLGRVCGVGTVGGTKPRLTRTQRSVESIFSGVRMNQPCPRSGPFGSDNAMKTFSSCAWSKVPVTVTGRYSTASAVRVLQVSGAGSGSGGA